MPEVASYIENGKRSCEEKVIPFPLYKWIHHGLSSQACLFNLLGSLVVNKEYQTLRGILSLSGLNLGGDVSCAEFEFEDRSIFNEYQGKPTSVDLFVRTNEDERVFIEFKFTESEFGTCLVYEDGDCDGANPNRGEDLCYLHKLGTTYMDLMRLHGLLGDAEHCPFTEFYQAYRLLLFALEYSGVFLLVHDDRNPAFYCEVGGKARGKYQRFKRLLPKPVAGWAFILSIQRIVEYVERHPEYGRKYHEWMTEFKHKYL